MDDGDEWVGDGWVADTVRPAELRSLLDRVVRGMGAPGTDAVELVFNRWSEVVGGVLATRTRPVSLDGGRLLLEADEPAVVSHVRWLERDLLDRLAELLGGGRVTAVDVRVTPLGRRGRSAPAPTGDDDASGR